MKLSFTFRSVPVTIVELSTEIAEEEPVETIDPLDERYDAMLDRLTELQEKLEQGGLFRRNLTSAEAVELVKLESQLNS